MGAHEGLPPISPYIANQIGHPIIPNPQLAPINPNNFRLNAPTSPIPTINNNNIPSTNSTSTNSSISNTSSNSSNNSNNKSK